MLDSKQIYLDLKLELKEDVKLIAVSKTNPINIILEVYEWGQKDFGENYVQEMVDKYTILPKDIRWHFIGHLQSNKVKFIAPFVELIHGVDTLKLLVEINRQGLKFNRVINCLLQVHLAREETKFGLSEEELSVLVNRISQEGEFNNVNVCGLMGLASFTKDMEQVRREFTYLKSLYDKHSAAAGRPAFTTLSMGMSADYKIAIEEGSNMVRIGSLIFGERHYDT